MSALVVDGLFSADELHSFHRIIDEGTAVKTRPFTTAAFKNGKVLHDSIPQLMFERVRPHLPDVYTDAVGVQWEFVRGCQFLMYAELTAGQQFNLHTDTGCVWDERGNRYSKFTLLLYLNDDYVGGQTEFFDDAWRRTETIEPVAGRTLVFDIDLWHRGCEVREGIKRWIGTEIVCARRPDSMMPVKDTIT